MDPNVAQRMRKHVTSLAAEHGVTLHWIRSWREAHAFPEEGTAFVPEIHKPSDYYFALHEIGHVADEVARSQDQYAADVYVATVVEGAAWAWAAEHALPALRRHLRKADWDRIGYAFRTYVAGGI